MLLFDFDRQKNAASKCTSAFKKNDPPLRNIWLNKLKKKTCLRKSSEKFPLLDGGKPAKNEQITQGAAKIAKSEATNQASNPAGRPPRRGGGSSDFQTSGAFTAKKTAAFFFVRLSAPSGRKASLFALGDFVGRVPVDVQACSLTSLFPVRGTPWLVPGFGWGFIIMPTTSKHTPPSQLLLLTCHRTRNRRFCISVWSFLSQPLQPQPIRAREH